MESDYQRILDALLARTQCPTCSRENLPRANLTTGEWMHLNQDDSLLGPCDDFVVAAALNDLAALAQ